MSDINVHDDVRTSEPSWPAAHWMISFGYVWFFAGIAAFTPFAAIYYRSLGFSSWQVGLLAQSPLGAASNSSPGRWEDAYQSYLESPCGPSVFLTPPQISSTSLLHRRTLLPSLTP